MEKTEHYARKYLSREIKEIERSARGTELGELSLYEKAIIYKYSEDGYESVNEYLRDSKGSTQNLYGNVLNSCLSKLKNYQGVVFRCANLTEQELKNYRDALAKNIPVAEYAFVSTSKSELTAIAFGRNTKFIIYSETGKEIEKIAKFGKHNPPNEKEVLFKSGTHFNILEITKENNYILITMEEI